MSRLRVFQLLPSLGMGGAERLAVHLSRALAEAEYDVRVVSMYDRVGSDLEEMLALASVPVSYLGKRPGLDPRMVPALRGAFRRHRPHVVHTHLRVLQYALPAYLGSRARARVHTVHNLATKEATRPGRVIQAAAFKAGVVPVAISEEVERSIEAVYGFKAPVVANAIPVDDYAADPARRASTRASLGIEEGAVVFVCVANLSQAKGHARLIAAFEKVRSTVAVPVTLLLVGDGPLRRSLEALAAPHGTAVKFLGARTDVADILGAADAFVLASDYEGSPLSIMEAMAAGLPVVATAVGGVPELVTTDHDGVLVPGADVPALSAAMAKAAVDRAWRRRLGAAAALTAAARFGVSGMARAYAALYEELAAGARLRRSATDVE